MHNPTSILFLAVVVFMTGCTNNPVNQTPEEPAFTTVKSALVVRDSVPASELLVSQQAQSNNEFSLALYKLLVEEGKNCFFSPYSITAALAMTASGAANNTLSQMRSAMNVTLPGTTFDEALNSIDLSITTYADRSDGITFKAVNSTWMQTGCNFSIGFLNQLSQYYGAGMNLLDFANNPDKSLIIINDWVAEQTQDKILNLLPQGSIDQSTVLVLTNAVYFLAKWKKSFDATYTKDSNFSLSDNSTVNVPMMHFVEPRKRVAMPYVRRSGVRAMDFPYQGDRIVMTVFLPDVDSLTAFEDALSTALLDTLYGAQEPESLSVSLPKFQFTFGTKSIATTLKTLGMNDAFDPSKADFTAMSSALSLYISDVFHKAFIAVDEAGTEAAAATGVAMDVLSINNNMVSFNVNRPFIFIIRDKVTGTILFMGRVVNPLVAS